MPLSPDRTDTELDNLVNAKVNICHGRFLPSITYYFCLCSEGLPIPHRAWDRGNHLIMAHPEPNVLVLTQRHWWGLLIH